MDALKDERPPAGAKRADWEKAAAAVLTKSRRMTDTRDPAEVLHALSTRSVDGVTIPALGFAEDLQALPATGEPGTSPLVRGNQIRTDGWDVRIPIKDPNLVRASRSVLTDLERGGSSLWVTVGDSGTALADLPELLAGVFLDFAPVVLQADASVEPKAVAQAYLDILAERRLAPAAGSNLGFDPIGRLATNPDATLDLAAQVAEIASLTTLPGLRSIVIDGTVLHNAGASDAQELAYSIAAGVTYLRLLAAAGIEPDRAVGLLEFRYAATDNQFLTIAKFRAARKLWHRVAQLSGVTAGNRSQVQHAVTSWAMMTKYDPWVNILRTTVAAFAAGTGGAEALTVLPFDEAIGVSDDMARRVARNTSALLVSESHVAKVTDPAGGSYAVESLTDSLAHAAWTEFDRIETDGGLIAALADGSLANRVAEVAAQRAASVADRKLPITGLSEFPMAGETLLVREPVAVAATEAFQGHRYGEAYERLRDNPSPTGVFLATIGPAASYTPRATFVSNLLTAGGIGVIAAPVGGSIDAVVSAFGAAGTTVAVIAGNDQGYQDEGAALATALRAAGASWIILAGRPNGEIATLVDDHIVAGANAIDFLTNTRSHLTGAS